MSALRDDRGEEWQGMQRVEAPGSALVLGRLLWKPSPQRGSLHRVTSIKTGGVRGKERKGEKKGGEGGAKKRKKTRRRTDRNVSGETCDVETSRGLGLASLNILNINLTPKFIKNSKETGRP